MLGTSSIVDSRYTEECPIKYLSAPNHPNLQLYRVQEAQTDNVRMTISREAAL